MAGYEPACGRIGAITDDTQMTLFTAEALLGRDAIPGEWFSDLELRETIEQIAGDSIAARRYDRQ